MTLILHLGCLEEFDLEPLCSLSGMRIWCTVHLLLMFAVYTKWEKATSKPVDLVTVVVSFYIPFSRINKANHPIVKINKKKINRSREMQ